MQELSFGGEIPGGRRRRAPQGFDCYPESAIRQLSARLGVDCGFPLSRNFLVRTCIKRTFANKIEAMYERSRKNV